MDWKTTLRDVLIGALIILVLLFLAPTAVLSSAPPVAIMAILAIVLTVVCAKLTGNSKLTYFFAALAVILILLALWPGIQITLPFLGGV